MKKYLYSTMMTLCCLAVTATAQAATFTFTISNTTKKTDIEPAYCNPVQIKVINKGMTVSTNGTKNMVPGAVETITTNDTRACTSIELSTTCGGSRPSLTTYCNGGQILITSPSIMIRP